MPTKLRALTLVLITVLSGVAQNIDPSSLDGKVLLGYQGWFRCPGGGTMGTNWSHWANGVPAAASLVIDMYPDLREFEQGETCAVPGMTIGPNPASLFSSGNSRTARARICYRVRYQRGECRHRQRYPPAGLALPGGNSRRHESSSLPAPQWQARRFGVGHWPE